MNKLFSIILLSFFGFTNSVHATSSRELSASAQLRKLSLSLRGTIPSLEEFEAINKVPVDQVQAYLSNKARTYMSTEAYAEKMQQRLQGLFRIRLSQNVKLQSTSSQVNYYNEMSFNSLDQIFLDIVRNNLSWDQLLQRKTYQIFDKTDSNYNSISDAGFFKGVFPDQIGETFDGVITSGRSNNYFDSETPKGAPIEVRTDSQRLATAGTLTTSRFFARYPTTKLNKNRKRAAAVFRVFLCDEMRPVVLPGANENLELLALAFNEDGAHSAGGDIAEVEKQHGSDPACQSCHYKLDPAGRTFMTSGLVLNPTPASGALVYKRADGSLVNVPVNGIGELANAITQQPEYAQCQVKHFWDWFIGKDVVMTSSRQKELVEKFDSLGRKPNDFVTHLISLPEYRQIPRNEEQLITLSNVKPIFRQCNECHSGEGTVPEFYRFPIGGTGSTHEEWITKISDELDLANDGVGATMPPKRKTDWRLSKSEIALIKRWISEGAKDETSQPTIPQELSSKLIPGGVQVATQIEATFDDTFFRYFENHDLFRVLDQFFGSSNMNEYRCRQLDENNDYLLGVKNTLDGRPIFQSASPNYLRLVQECSLKFYDSHATASSGSSKGSFIKFSPTLIKAKNITDLQFSNLSWASLTEQEQNSQIIFLMYQLIGRGVLPQEVLNSKVNAIRTAIAKQSERLLAQKKQVVDVNTATRWTTSLIVSSESFLTF